MAIAGGGERGQVNCGFRIADWGEDEELGNDEDRKKENDSGTRRNKAEQPGMPLINKGLGGGTSGETW